MSLKGNLLRSALALGAGAIVTSMFVLPASARVVVGFGFGVPVVAAPWYYAAPPVVYAPPPVIYAAPPPPPQPAFVSQPATNWYYCDNPRGYYPYVASCATAWREVSPQPNTAALPHP